MSSCEKTGQMRYQSIFKQVTFKNFIDQHMDFGFRFGLGSKVNENF